ncbi:MAG: hypothetical protein WEA36_10640 [Balneolaceae bacterium]
MSWSSGKALKGVRQVSAYAPYKQLADLFSMLRLEDEEEQPPARKEPSSKENLSWVEQALGTGEETVLDLIFDRGYHKMVRFFLTPNHDEILSIRSRIRRGESSNAGAKPIENQSVKTEILSGRQHRISGVPAHRDRLYLIQMQLYTTSKGIHFHMIV